MLDVLLPLHRAAVSALRAYRGALRQLRPVTLDRHAVVRLRQLTTENEALRHLTKSPQERARLRGDIRNEYESVRRRAAQGQRFIAAAVVTAAVTEARTRIDRARHNCQASMPNALDNVTADGMIALALLRLQLSILLTKHSAAELHARYCGALDRRDPSALVEVELIEQLADTRSPLSMSTSDRAAAQRLREHIDGVRELRLPVQLPDFDHLAAELTRLDARADLLKVSPLDPKQHTEIHDALDAEGEAMAAAGEASDADDQAALRAELLEAQ